MGESRRSPRDDAARRPWWELEAEQPRGSAPVRSPWADELARSSAAPAAPAHRPDPEAAFGPPVPAAASPRSTLPPARPALREADGGAPGRAPRTDPWGALPPKGGAPGGRGPAAGTGGGPSPQRRRRLRRTLLSVTAGLTVLVVAAGVFVYQHLNGNLRSDPLFAGVTGNAGTEKPDPFGRVPINILLIGSDTRGTAADCQLGGGCHNGNGGAGANADVQMVVHVAADRSNATVMSVPRDTITDLPACHSPQGATMAAHRGQINSTLAYGPGCTVAAVHQLTGITIDHFVMVDFAGVIAMSDAAGGAEVCVSGNVYDTYSHLKLAKGDHTLKGLAALEFVRSRHAFGDGSDLGRTYAQHIFLSAVIRNLKSAGTLANPSTLYSLADAATKALTVDNGLASITSLLGLATDLNKVPTKRITFTTMQTGPDPMNPNRVVPAASASKLFALIANDQALTAAEKPTPAGTAAPAPSGAAAPAPAPAPLSAAEKARTVVRVENGSGRPGRASTIAQALIGKGFSPRTTYTTAAVTATTSLRYGPGQLARAQAVAGALGLPASVLHTADAAGVVLILGTDWPTGTSWPGAASAPSPADTAAALDQAHAQTADTPKSCATVSTQRTVALNGAPMTPGRAYALSTDVPVSAP